MPVEVRRVSAEDWPAVRAVRLEALEDTPLGYLERVAEARLLPDEEWQARTAQGAPGGESFQVIARDGGRPVGSCVCFLRDGMAWLAGVYVAPAYRGAGLLGDLAEPCAVWAREQGMTVLRLEVHERNTRAQRAYERLGFTRTGQRWPYPLPPGGDELVMERPL